jgi:Domain of unknown function (DUF4340)
MSRVTLAVLALVVALLGFVAWRQVRKEAGEKRNAELALFEGVDPARVKRLLVENLLRDQHLAFERDEQGRWWMTEPTRIRADQTTVQHLFEVLLDRRGEPLASTGVDLRALNLAPPRAILEMEVEPGGPSHRIRVDVGSIDLDGAHLNVKAGGKVLRTWRDIDTMLDRTLEDYMSHDVVELGARDIVEFHRRGSLVRAGEKEPSDLTLDAISEEGAWRVTAPVTAPLDPDVGAIYAQGLASLHGERIIDFGHGLLGDLGLDPPEMTITASTVGAKTIVLRFGRPGHLQGVQWNCVLEGQSTVWQVNLAAVDYFASSVEIFLDQKLTRFPTQAFEALTLAFEGHELRVWKEKTQMRPGFLWKVAERAGPEAAFSKGLPADARRVEDLLDRASGVKIASYLHGEALDPAEIRGSIAMGAGGEHEGGSFGREVGTPEKGRAIRCQRTGDSIAGLADPSVLDLLRTPMSEVLSLVVIDLPEIEQTGLTIRGEGAQRAYVHTSKGLWTPPDVAIEAREVRDVLDTLLILRATKHLPEGPQVPLAEPIEIEIRNMNGTKTTYTIGRAPDAPDGERVLVERDGRRAIVKDQDVHARLLKILHS